MARTALDDLDVRIGNQRQHIARLGADVLRPGMAGGMQRHAAVEGAEAGRQALVSVYIDDIFGDIAARRREPGDGLVAGQQERPFSLEHERAGRHQGDDGIALVDPAGEVAGDAPRPLGDRVEIAVFELGHAAAGG